MTTPSEIYPWLEQHWSFFLKRLNAQRLAHALLIQGPMGCGKMALARAMVARLLCREGQPCACGSCRSCELLAGGAHPDSFELQPEEGSEIVKIDQVRDLIARLGLTTSISSRKVACIHPAETMNMAAANALLKSLEEPAGNTVLILVSNNPGRLPVTIRSRCQAISVQPPDKERVLDWLEKTSGEPAGRTGVALTAAGGSPLRAIEYLTDALDGYGQIRQELITLLEQPASVPQVNQQLASLNPVDLWRWISLCCSEIIISVMTEVPLHWLPVNMNLRTETLFQLQRQADINRELSSTQLRGDLLLQDWLIRWAEQDIRIV